MTASRATPRGLQFRALARSLTVADSERTFA
jgi:hypothetical protein